VSRRRWIMIGLVGVAVPLGALGLWAVGQARRATAHLQAALTAAVPGLMIQSVTTAGLWPTTLIARGVTVANPTGFTSAHAVSLPSVRLTYSPWLWIVGRVLVVDLELESPAVILERDVEWRANLQVLWEAARSRARRYGGAPVGLATLRLVPRRVVVTDGRFDLIDRRLKPEGVLLPVRALTIRLEADLSGLRRETAVLGIRGHFVDRAGEPVGDVAFDSRFFAKDRGATVDIRFAHRRLAELQPYLRLPYEIAEGDGTADVHGRVDAERIRCDVTLVARRLVLHGEAPLQGVLIQEVLGGLRDSEGVITLAFEVAGRWGDPSFNFHDGLVQQLERTMRQRLAEQGIVFEETP